MKHLIVSFAGAGLLAGCGLLATPGPEPSSEKEAAAAPVERQYGKSADKVWDATLSALKSFDLRIDVDRHDELGGEIIARRADGRRMTAHVASVDKDCSKVSIVADRTSANVAAQLHERIAEKLGMGEAKAALFGGNTLEGAYPTDFAGALAAAERACKALGLEVTRKEAHDRWAQLDARTDTSMPVRFRMESRDDRISTTAVKFIAGHGKTDDSRNLVSRMKAEFDKQVALPAK